MYLATWHSLLGSYYVCFQNVCILLISSMYVVILLHCFVVICSCRKVTHASCLYYVKLQDHLLGVIYVQHVYPPDSTIVFVSWQDITTAQLLYQRASPNNSPVCYYSGLSLDILRYLSCWELFQIFNHQLKTATWLAGEIGQWYRCILWFVELKGPQLTILVFSGFEMWEISH